MRDLPDLNAGQKIEKASFKRNWFSDCDLLDEVGHALSAATNLLASVVELLETLGPVKQQKSFKFCLGSDFSKKTTLHSMMNAETLSAKVDTYPTFCKSFKFSSID